MTFWPLAGDSVIDFSDLKIPSKLWDLIATGDGTSDGIRRVLEQLSREDLILFEYYFDCATVDLADRARGAGVQSPSEDATMQLCGWVVSQGRSYYQRVFENIEQHFPDPDEEEVGVSYYGVAGSIYEGRYHEAMPERFDWRWE